MVYKKQGRVRIKQYIKERDCSMFIRMMYVVSAIISDWQQKYKREEQLHYIILFVLLPFLNA
jgi:hypothetical protein